MILTRSVSNKNGGTNYLFANSQLGYRTYEIDGALGCGIKAYDSQLDLGDTVAGGVIIQNCASHGIELHNSVLRLNSGVLSGAGNGGAGIYAYNGSIVNTKSGTIPTITGAVGDLSVTDPTIQEDTWANIEAGTIVSISAENTLVRTRA